MNTSEQEKFSQQKVLWVKRYGDKLMTFAIDRPSTYRFSAGQFSRLGFHQENGYVWRAYSVMSPEYAENLEYIAVLIPNGPMSQKLAQLQAGDHILLDKTATGFLLPDRFADGEELVMLATGSGIAPFLSQIQQAELWTRFKRIIITHCVRQENDLIFSDLINDLSNHPLVGKFAKNLCYLPIVTGEKITGILHHRLPELLRNGSLAAAAQTEFSANKTRFMICGNPQMVQDTFQELLKMGFAMHRNRLPGQILMENGF